MALLMWLGHGSSAHACSCGLSCDLVAPSGDVSPAGAGVLLRAGCGNQIPWQRHTVTVDGAPAELVPHEEIWFSGGNILFIGYGLAMIEPSTHPGQEVVVTRCGVDCEEVCPQEAESVEVLRYVATDYDESAPAITGTVSLGHDESSFYLSCSDEDLEYVAILAIVEHDADEALLLGADLRTPSGTSLRTSFRAVDASPESVVFYFYVRSAELQADPADLCVDVWAADLSGNVTSVAMTCGSTPPPVTETEDETSGSDADAGTAGDDTTTMTGHHDADDGPIGRGCGCNSRPRDSIGFVFLFGLALGGGRPKMRRS
jgi:hypothetical protein